MVTMKRKEKDEGKSLLEKLAQIGVSDTTGVEVGSTNPHIIYSSITQSCWLYTIVSVNTILCTVFSIRYTLYTIYYVQNIVSRYILYAVFYNLY